MKKPDFKTQMYIMITILIILFAVSTVTKIEFFSNAGTFIYGLAFFINPVYPKSASGNHKTLERTSRICGFILMLFSFIAKF